MTNTIINPLFGLLLGPFVGAITAELLLSNRKFTDAVKVGLGALLGFFGGGILKFLLSVFMVVSFIKQIF